MQRFVLTVLSAAACLASLGCESTPAPRPAAISHIVFFELNNPLDRRPLLEDCDEQIATIPGVVSYAAGTHIDVGRPTVKTDYDVALYIGFNDTDAYAEYVDHPQHTTLVEAWKPRIKSLRVYDFYDDTP